MELSPQLRELATQAIAGDQVALSVLLTELEPLLRRRLEGRTPMDLRSVLDADDLLQDVYSDVFRAITRFRPQDDGAFDRWLATVALRRLRAEIRRHRAAKRGGGARDVRRVAGGDESAITLLRLIESAEKTPSRAVASRELVAAVAAALDRLPESHREAVRLVHLEGLTVAEAAARMGRTDRAVHNLCFKARQHLRELLGDVPTSGSF